MTAIPQNAYPTAADSTRSAKRGLAVQDAVPGHGRGDGTGGEDQVDPARTPGIGVALAVLPVPRRRLPRNAQMGRQQLDWHWRTNLRPRLEGLTDEEYFWEPVRGCWSIRPRGASAAPMSEGSGKWTMDFASPGPVPAPVTTIAWRLAHLIVSCLGYRVGWYFGGQDVDSQTFAYAGTADEALKQLDEMYGIWNAGVRELSDADLENPPRVGPERFPMENRVLHVNRELIHHGAEISLLRDLCRWQDGAVPHRM